MDKETQELSMEYTNKNLEEINREIISYKDMIRHAKMKLVILEKQKRQYEIGE
jgi:hypothetical protein